MGPLPASSALDGCSQSYRYLVTCIDRTTRWLEAIPVADITAPTIAHTFYGGWITRWGVPLTLITDLGRQFESQLWRKLSTIVGFQRIRTTSYHLQSNGLIERQHRTLKTALRTHLQEKDASWLLHLPTVLFSLRIQPSETNNLSPFKIVTEQKIHEPATVFQNPKKVTTEYIEKLAQSMKTLTFTTTPRTSQVLEYIAHELKDCITFGFVLTE